MPQSVRMGEMLGKSSLSYGKPGGNVGNMGLGLTEPKIGFKML